MWHKCKKAFEFIVNYRINLATDVIDIEDYEDYLDYMQNNEKAVWLDSAEWYLLKRLTDDYLKDKETYYEMIGYLTK